jgi:hypothetical protein
MGGPLPLLGCGGAGWAGQARRAGSRGHRVGGPDPEAPLTSGRGMVIYNID